MNKQGFKIWLEPITDIQEYSKGRYVNAPDVIDSWLEEGRLGYPPIYEIENIETIEEIQKLEIFKVKNRKENRMHGSALNYYKRYLKYKNLIRELLDDEEFASQVDTYLSNINSDVIEIVDEVEEVPAQIERSNRGYKRNPRKPAEAILQADYKCQVDGNHRSFTSKSTGENYCEGHHLIPMNEQSQFSISLDVHANIVSLCPTCHRTLHHGVIEEKKAILIDLYNTRISRLVKCGIVISLEELIQFYD